MRSQKVKLTVITDMEGTVLATKQALDPDAIAELAARSGDGSPMPVFSRLVAGPDQQAHEVEVEVPERVFETQDAVEIHRIVQDRMKQTGG